MAISPATAAPAGLDQAVAAKETSPAEFKDGRYIVVLAEAAAAAYETDFGVVPSFWAGLHLGPVVTGEIGTIKHEIAFLGDTLNAASRRFSAMLAARARPSGAS